MFNTQKFVRAIPFFVMLFVLQMALFVSGFVVSGENPLGLNPNEVNTFAKLLMDPNSFIEFVFLFIIMSSTAAIITALAAWMEKLRADNEAEHVAVVNCIGALCAFAALMSAYNAVRPAVIMISAVPFDGDPITWIGPLVQYGTTGMFLTLLSWLFTNMIWWVISAIIFGALTMTIFDKYLRRLLPESSL